ncbi:MAG: hypothetical protein IKE24_07075 [Clostridia bacterium]|nr:hypothetical protein [Clostridia bacterium]
MKKERVGREIRRALIPLGAGTAVSAALSGTAWARAGAPDLWSAFPWRSLGMGIVGYGAVFWLAARARLFRRERALFGALKRQAGVGRICFEAVYQLLLAGVLFLLLRTVNGEPPGMLRGLFALTASLIGAAAVIHAPIPAGLRRGISGLACGVLALGSYYVLTTYGYTRWTEAGWRAFGGPIERMLPLMQAAGLALTAAEFRTDARRALAICGAEALLYRVTETTGYGLMAGFCGMMLITNLCPSPRRRAKVFFFTLLGYAVFLAAGLMCGWVEDSLWEFSYAGVAHGYGMGHSNQPAAVLMSLLLLGWYLWAGDRPAVTLCLCWGFAAAIWFLTYCRTVVIVLAVFPGLNLLRIAAGKGRRRRNRWMAWLPAFFAAGSIGGMLWIPRQGLFSAQGNFFLRFTIPDAAVRAFGIRPFGMKPAFEEYVIDNLYLHVLVFFGAVSLAVLLVLLCRTGARYAAAGQEREGLLFAAMLFYGLMENALIHMPFGFAAMLAAAAGAENRPGGGMETILRSVRRIRAEMGQNLGSK